MLKNYLFIIILFSFSFFLYAGQDSLSYSNKNLIRIDSISVTGNDITEEDIILRELTFKAGDKIDLQLLNYNKERIYSLGIFNKVDLNFKKELKKNILVIKVEESWYIYPIPFVQLKDRDWKKFSYGLDFIVKNFRGRNELLRVRGSLGYDPSIFISYYNPVLIQKQDIFLNLILSYTDRKNKSIIAETIFGSDFDQKFFSAQIGLGKRFGLFNRVNLSLGYDYIESPIFIKGISASNNRIDRVPSVGLSYSLDTRDLIQFPKEGIFGSASIVFKGMDINNVDYRVMNFDFREYLGLFNNLFFKWRLTTRLTAGKLIPFYDFSFLGYEERVRGHFTDIIEGNDYYLGSLELYSALLKDTQLSLDFIPILPKELLSYRIAIYAQLFADAGAAKIKNIPLKVNDFQSGYGVGLTFLFLPYNSFRVEFALDEYRNPEWIFDLGISF